MNRNPTGPCDQPVGPQPGDQDELCAGSRRGTEAARGTVVINSGPVLWRQVVPVDEILLVPGDLSYKSTDPYAVCIAFEVNGDTLEWFFARALLIGGLLEPVGAGDIVISPSRHDGVETVQITLKNLDECAVVEAPARIIAAFLKRTCEAVPPGTERRHIDLNHLVCRLVQESA